MPNNTNIRSEAIQDILAKTPHWMITWGNIIILFLIFIFFLLSWIIKYPDVIAAKALITTESPPQKVIAKTSGIIDTILVKDNQNVLANTPLAIIENTANYRDVLFLKEIIDSIKPNNISFEFPIESIPVLFLGDIDSEFAIFENNYLQYQLNKKLQPYSNEAIANKFSSSELHRRLANLKSQKKLNEAELKFQEGDLKRYKSLYEKGVISLQEYELQQTNFLRAERNFANVDASISQTRVAISSANKTFIGTSINKTKEEISLLKNVIQSFNQLKRALKDWEMRYVLSSNIDGEVSFLNIWNKNQNVNLGDLVFTIIPLNNSNFIAKLKTPAQNSGKIKIGQNVFIDLENYPTQEFGALKGRIKSISQFSDDDGYYLIDVILPLKLITNYQIEIDFKQEMKGAAEIITEDLRLIDRFFYQFRNVFSN